MDDDDISRAGMATVLGHRPEIQVVAALTHVEALAWPGEWGRLEAVLVDAADDRAYGDQFPGVAVVEHVRRHRQRGRPSVIVVTGHFFDDAVRRRMREARADFFYHRSAVADARVLHDIVLHPDVERSVPGPHDPAEPLLQGVTDESRVNRAVGYALRTDLQEALVERARPRSRSWMRLRREFNQEGRLSSVTLKGRSPDRNQDVPSLAQIGRFLAWATKVKSGSGDPRMAPARGRRAASREDPGPWDRAESDRVWYYDNGDEPPDDAADDPQLDVDRVYCLDLDAFGEADWATLSAIYAGLPGWLGDGYEIPRWFSADESSHHLWASVEPSGLLVAGTLPASLWRDWDAAFRAAAVALPHRDID